MRILKLIKVSIQGNTWFSKAGIKELYRRDLLWIVPIAFGGIAVLLGFIIYFLINIYNNLILIGIQINKPELLFFYAIIGSWIFIFLAGIPLFLSTLYYSKDIRLLLYLPIKPVEIIISKFTLVLLYLLPINFLFICPAVFVYIKTIGISFELVITSIIQMLISPLFPLSLSMLFVISLGKIVNLGRFKTAFEVGLMFFALAVIVFIQILISQFFLNQVDIIDITSLTDIFDRLIYILFPVGWAARSFFPKDGLVYLLLAKVVYLTSFCIAIVLAKINFIDDVNTRIYVSWRKGKKQRRKVDMGKSNIIYALLKKEWHILFSNSTFIFQTVGELCVFPLMLLIFFFVIPGELLNNVKSIFPGGPFSGLIVFGLSILFTNISSISSTSLSREGKTFMFSILIPVSGRKHLISKLLLHIFLYFPVFIIDSIIIGLLLKTQLLNYLYIIPGGLVFLILAFIANISIDLKRPVLNWSHPMQAVKNNLNVLAGLGISFGYILFFGGISWVLLFLLYLHPVLIGFGLMFTVLIIDLILFRILSSYAEKRYCGGIEIV